MKRQEELPTQQNALIASKIFTLRNEKVILDVHLADFYDIETRALKQAVRRNRDRFPSDFMFELREEEVMEVVSQNVIPSKGRFGGAIPFAFTENGVAMLSSVLNSKKAIQVNIEIMRTFTMLRKFLLLQKDLVIEFETIREKLTDHEDKILLLFEYFREIEEINLQQIDQINRNRIGYKRWE